MDLASQNEKTTSLSYFLIRDVLNSCLMHSNISQSLLLSCNTIDNVIFYYFVTLNLSAHPDIFSISQARIVAMTCTYAAMTRGRLVELGFKYDSLIMEEAAQVDL